MILDTDNISSAFDVQGIRQQFPALRRQIHGKPLVYFDSAASSLKPQPVIDALSNFYGEHYANIHRGLHTLSQESTAAYEEARAKVADFLGAGSPDEIVFTRNATESINLVARGWGTKFLQAGDEILLTEMEHHANIVPWQMLAEERGLLIKVIPVTDEGELDLEAFETLLSERTKLVSFVHVSNALGTVNPAEKIIQRAHEAGAKVLLDGAQSTVHFPVDLQRLDCDFFVFSGHKLFAPSGIGVLYGRAERLESMDPYQGGGDMIERVSFEKTTFAQAPGKFEAGTPHIAGAVGLAAAIDFVRGIDLAAANAYEDDLLAYGTERLLSLPGVNLYGRAEQKVSVLSFTIDGVHPSDLGTMLDLDGIAVRTGHHCCMPLWQRFGIEGTTRASLAYFNTRAEIDLFVASLEKIRKLFV